MTRIALLYHPLVENSQRLAHELVAVVEAAGHGAWVESAWAREEVAAEAVCCELVVVLGGDGTILRVSRATLRAALHEGSCLSPPLLTVNYGRLGFLAEVQPEEAVAALRQVIAGDYWIEERRLLRATLERDGQPIEERLALNEVVLARGDGPHAIRLTLLVDGAEAARYTADAMIIASPTGSTAYALAAGGPIMGPDVAGMLALPVAPHLAVARGFVLPDSSRVTLHASALKTTVVTLDGQTTLPYHEGDRLHVTMSDAVARFVRIGPRNYFYATLRDKLRRG